MDRKNFERQVTGFTDNDPAIIDRAMQTVANYYENPTAFSDSVANTPSPEHLWNLALCAKHYNDANVAMVIRTVAMASINIIDKTLYQIQDPVVADQERDNLANYKHVVSLLDSF